MHYRRTALSLRASLIAIAVSGAFTAGGAFAQTADQQSEATNCPTSTTLNAENGKCEPTVGAVANPTDVGDSGAPPQNTAPAGNEIVITGSRIARLGTDTVAPVQVLDSKAIEARGFSTLGQALSEQPAFGIADSSTVGAQSSFGPGQSFVNFFGLGSQRTLTLVNSRRFVGSNTSTVFGPTGSGGSQVDLNLIPTKLIDRVETVAIGGAPIYGSDAIAGTINVILKKNYEGLDLDAQYGIAERGDAPDYRFRVLAGKSFADGRGNITFAGEYNESTGLLYNDRDLPSRGRYSDRTALADPDSPYLYRYYQNRRIPSISENGVPLVGQYLDLVGLPNVTLSPAYQDLLFGAPYNVGVSDGTAQGSLRFDKFGNLVPIDFGTVTGFTNSSGGNGYSLTDLSNLLTNTKRYSGIVQANYQLTDGIHSYVEAWYTHSEGTNLRDQPEYNAGLFGSPGDLVNAGAFRINLANPFLSSAARATIQQSINENPLSDQNLGIVDTQDYFFLDRANTDLINGRVKGEIDTYRAVLGFDGAFEVFGGKAWKWEVFGNYGRSESKSRQPTLNSQNLANAVDAIGTSPADATCRPGVVNSTGPTISSTCAPLNLFGNGQASQAALDYVTMIATPKSVNEQVDFVGTLSGPLFSLPGGDLSFAVGYEHRDEHTNFDPSPALGGFFDTVSGTQQGYGQSVPIAAINAGYNTDEIFGELDGDLIGPENNIPLVHSLSFQTAARYVDNSFNGGAFTWTAGGRWAPIADLTLRGNFTRSIRSPSITEFAAPQQSTFSFATDPCDPTSIADGPNPTARAANCAAAFNALGVDLDSYNSLADERSFRQAVAGDASLDNETANSWTVGAIIQPRFIPRLTIAADYINIRVKDVISSFGSDDVLSGCYDATDYPNNQFCDRVQRDANGQLSYIVQGYVNADELHYRGIVGQGSYRLPTPFLGADSNLGLGVSYQHLFELSSTSGGTKTRSEGTAGYSQDKFVASLSYSDNGLELFGQAAYLGPAVISNTYAPNRQAVNHYNAVVFTNVGFSYTLPDTAFQFRFNVDNVFDQEPPYPSTGATDVYFRGTLGRFFRFGAAVHF